MVEWLARIQGALGSVPNMMCALGMAVYDCNSRIWEMEIGKPRVQYHFAVEQVQGQYEPLLKTKMSRVILALGGWHAN